ncbi:flagellar basal-body rod protein FlgF [Nisaea sp.]|uniref:flagellar basal-body rod protein FlgF n=1 Tax=Nisaea sp. TaxID=2024842 RepID=UPI002B26D89D|nr:flagellar basal-body rod protein FlgF [Nisaea sp.]
MENAIYIGLSRQSALRRELSLVANNIANSSTTAFKREIALYSPYETDTKMDEKLDFVIDHGTIVIHQPGTLQPTQNTFDVAIEGPGFFTVDNGREQMYTRNGNFKLSPDNQLITGNGELVMDTDDNPIFIPQDGRKIEISPDGTISAGPEVLGILKVVEFDDLPRMQKRGGSTFETTEQPRPPERSKMLQGHLETSNVSAISELTRLIDIQRSYESVKNMLDQEAERLRTSVRKLGTATAA